MLNAYPEETPLILIVDDDVVIRGMLTRLLSDLSYRVIEAENGREGVKQFQRQTPDLVLMDAAMPLMTGFEACEAIKQMPQGANVPVIMITSLHDEESVDRGFQAGAIEYITKPIHWAVLRNRITTLLKARRAEAALKRSEARFRGVFEQAGIGIILAKLDGQVLEVNDTLSYMLGMDKARLLQNNLNTLFTAQNNRVEDEFREQLLAGERHSYQMDKSFAHCENQEQCWARLTTSVLANENGEAEFYLCMAEDISSQKRAQEQARIADKVFENTTDAVLITNADGYIQDVNQSFVLMSGYSYAELLDKKPNVLKSDRHEKEFYQKMWHSLQKTGRWRGEIWNQRKSGEVYLQWLAISVVRDEYNTIKHYVAVYSNMPSLADSGEELRKLISYDEHMYQLTHYDSLTELPNPLLFHEQLMRLCRHNEPLGLINIDLDNFGAINDEFGFDAGDQYLKTVAERLSSELPSNAMPTRLEGDSFGIILAPLNQPYDARLIAEKVLAMLEAPIAIGNSTVHVDCHIGVSLCCFQEQDNNQSARERMDNLLQRADLATHLARQSGNNTYQVFSEEVLEAF